ACRIAAGLVAAQQGAFQVWGNDPAFSAHIEWVAIFIFGHSNQATVAAKAANGFYGQLTRT
ncbi:MAG: hypothetical protein QGD92_15885, partial [Gammaproteobacteria bacterium]|nr:hypothetical protein [Gammaproteobacteria bacterium]